MLKLCMNTIQVTVSLVLTTSWTWHCVLRTYSESNKASILLFSCKYIRILVYVIHVICLLFCVHYRYNTTKSIFSNYWILLSSMNNCNCKRYLSLCLYLKWCMLYIFLCLKTCQFDTNKPLVKTPLNILMYHIYNFVNKQVLLKMDLSNTLDILALHLSRF